jgi:hypothetical protein
VNGKQFQAIVDRHEKTIDHLLDAVLSLQQAVYSLQEVVIKMQKPRIIVEMPRLDKALSAKEN